MPFIFRCSEVVPPFLLSLYFVCAAFRNGLQLKKKRQAMSLFSFVYFSFFILRPVDAHQTVPFYFLTPIEPFNYFFFPPLLFFFLPSIYEVIRQSGGPGRVGVIYGGRQLFP